MPLQLDRRLLIKAGTFGLGALALPNAAFAFSTATGFTHGVASGEPDTQSVLLWTRFVASSDQMLTAEVSQRADFSRIIGGGSVAATGARDHIAKITVSGLSPGAWYFYRFVAPDGSVSPTGRTRTLPDDAISRFNIAVFSCSNLPFGWFNAYAHANSRNDIDLVMHLGDYLYEYQPGYYPSVSDAVPGRSIQPTREILTLADYRLRYAAYRADADLQRLHQLYPMIAMWDDHEITNDAWRDGAQNHQPESEGDYAARKRIAEQVNREWMPVSDRGPADVPYGQYQIGNLATIIKTESRLTGRDEQPDLGAALKGQADLGAALRNFRDTVWQDPTRQMLGATQEAWLANAFKSSKQSGTKWQVWAQQCVMGSARLPLKSADWIAPDAPDFVKERTSVGLAASKAGLPFNFDAWDGYPAARERALRSAQAAGANLIVLSGDSHNGWAFDLDADGRPAGVEFAGQSVTSPGFEAYAPRANKDDIATALIADNPQLKWVDTSNRGYMTVNLTPEAATSNWHNVTSIRAHSTKLDSTVSHSAAHGRNVIGN